jgi:hypothetical protein
VKHSNPCVFGMDIWVHSSAEDPKCSIHFRFLKESVTPETQNAIDSGEIRRSHVEFGSDSPERFAKPFDLPDQALFFHIETTKTDIPYMICARGSDRNTPAKTENCSN